MSEVTQEVSFTWACVITHAAECEPDEDMHDGALGLSSYLLLDKPLTNMKNKMANILNVQYPNTYVHNIHV